MNVLKGNIEQLIAWAISFFTCLKAHMATWGISATWVTEVENKFTDLQNAHATWVNPATRTKAAHTLMEEKRQLFVHAVEPMIQNLRTLPTLTPQDYNLLQIAPPSKGPGPAFPPPETWPLLTVEVHGQCTADIHYRDVNTPLSRAKPRGVHEAIVRMGFAEETPTSVDDLTETPLTLTRTPHRVVFPSDRAGKILHLVAAWVNPTGKRGPWGPVVSVFLS
ncbi:MAG: hypothetical protein LBP50_07875 [Tannerella sp.]|jgi:hypothetical protein|nr:hypothetical protein [Tannerella sp.]